MSGRPCPRASRARACATRRVEVGDGPGKASKGSLGRHGSTSPPSGTTAYRVGSVLSAQYRSGTGPIPGSGMSGAVVG
jgi:hypothetical protein